MASTSSGKAGNQHDEGSQQKCNPRQYAERFVVRSAHGDIFPYRNKLSKWTPKFPLRKQIERIGSNSKQNNELALANSGREFAGGEFVPKMKHSCDPVVLK